jgi:hypothetical protein
VVTLYQPLNEKWKIAIYPADHGRPHYHIECPEHRCSVAIASGEVIVGSVPRAILKAARVWAAQHEDLLSETWKELNP